MSDPNLDRAAAATEVLTTRWFTASTPGEWVPNDYWKTPSICAELATFMSLAGNTDHLDTCDNAVAAGSPYFTTSGWLDDACSWGHLGVVAFDWLQSIGSTDAANYVSMASTIGGNLIAEWDDTCGGGLYWMRDPYAQGNFKASNSTVGMADIVLGVHFAGDATHDWVAWAQKAWTWIESKSFVDSNGLVWAGLTSSCEIDRANIPVIALQGNPLTPLWNLYRATQDTSYLDASVRIVEGTLTTFVWPGTSIFCTPFDGEWSSQTDDWRSQHVNDAMFKGVFAGYLGQLTGALAGVPERADEARRYAAALRANADALVGNYPAGVYGMNWSESDPNYQGLDDDTLNAVLQFSALSAFDAAARVAGVSHA
jgi:hypothetical protein